MLKRLLLFLVLGGVFFYGVAHLFALRFEHGDVYPAYSSLRTDPLGIKAFYDAFREQPGIRSSRNYRPIHKLKAPPATTLIYAGTPSKAFWEDKELETVEAMAAAGSRIVITFLSDSQGSIWRDLARRVEAEKERAERRTQEEQKAAEKKAAEANPASEKKPAPPEKAAPKKETPKKEAPEILSFDQVAARWGFAFKELPRNLRAPGKARRGGAADFLDEDISWHGALYFEPRKSGDWEPIYTFLDKPVIMERSYGSGSIVLAAESYFLSNEAMLKEPSPRLLAWLVGPSKTLVIDEESHGVREDPGISGLVGKYGLQGAVGVLALLAGLFVWKNAAPLVPPFEDSSGEVILGKDSSEGFVNLLRRGVAPGELLSVCAKEWKKAFDRDGTSSQGAHLDRVLAEQAGGRNTVAVYCALAAALAKPPKETQNPIHAHRPRTD